MALRDPGTARFRMPPLANGRGRIGRVPGSRKAIQVSGVASAPRVFGSARPLGAPTRPRSPTPDPGQDYKAESGASPDHARLFSRRKVPTALPVFRSAEAPAKPLA